MWTIKNDNSRMVDIEAPEKVKTQTSCKWNAINSNVVRQTTFYSGLTGERLSVLIMDKYQKKPRRHVPTVFFRSPGNSV